MEVQRQGLNGTMVANHLGVTKECVYHWLKGRRIPDGLHLVLLSELLGRTPGWFFGRSDVGSDH
jgi:DNA-binding transcriptional regulator YiaG